MLQSDYVCSLFHENVVCPRACLRIWSRETGSAVPSRVSLLISILKLNLVVRSRVIISTAPCCTKKLLCKKYTLLKKTKQPKSSLSLLVHQQRAHYYCTTTYYTTSGCPTRTANNAAVRAYTLLLYHHCCMYTYCFKYIMPTKLSPPCPVRTANITTMEITF